MFSVYVVATNISCEPDIVTCVAEVRIAITIFIHIHAYLINGYVAICYSYVCTYIAEVQLDTCV